MIHILAKEFKTFFNSLLAYIVMGVFLTAMGLILWVFPETSVMEYGYADLSSFFNLVPYVLLCLIPAITMRSFSEERKAGTFEWLVTKPLTEWEIILGKFFASLLLVLLTLVPTLLYYWSVWSLGDPRGNLDTPGIMGSYVGLLFLCAAFCSVGIFTSAVSGSQITAFVTAVFLCFLLFTGFDSVASIIAWSDQALTVQSLGMSLHYESLSRGLIDSRDVIYFISLSAFILLVTKTTLGARSW